MRSADSMIKSLGDRLGLPPRISARIVKGRRTLAHPFAVIERRRQARKLGEVSRWRGFVPQDKGYALAGPGKLPGLIAVVEACQRLYDAKRADDPQINKKLFFYNILELADLDAEPALLNFALSDAIIESATDYISTIPRLHAIGLYVSPVNDSTKSSQMFHLDGQDFRQLKCFVNIHSVGDADGPFSFLPADLSDQVAAALGHHWGDGRLEDKDIHSVTEEANVISLTGPPGTTALVDTCRCLHFGSRARENARIVFMFQYTPWPDARVDKTDKDFGPGFSLIDIPRTRGHGDTLRRLVLARR